MEIGFLRRSLEALLLELYFSVDAQYSNRRLSMALCAAANSDLRSALPSYSIPPQDFCSLAVDVWFRVCSISDFEGLQQALVRDHPDAEARIDALFRAALAEQAFREDGVSLQVDLYTGVDLVAQVKKYATPGGALERWLATQAPGITARTPTLPPVLFLVLNGQRLTSASLRIVGSRPRELPLPANSPGLPPGIDIGSGADLVRIVRRLINELRLPSSRELVLVIEADPSAVSLSPHHVQYPGSEETLEQWLTAVAWWPQIEGIPVEGDSYDDDLPAPLAGSPVAQWEQIPEDCGVRKSASLGVWASPTAWKTSSECPVLGRHGRRYFAVLADKTLHELIQDVHPHHAPASLHHLFATIKGRARLVWTDRRYVLNPGKYLR